MIRATVWSEFAESCKSKEALTVYPEGHHKVIADFLNKDKSIEATAATLWEPEQGLTDELLGKTDVLLWWGHHRHADITEETVEKIARRVFAGMGVIFLHSAHMSKPFRRIVGASGRLNWGDNERERLFAVNPSHPIVKGLPEYIDLPCEEMYGEPFGIPEPDETVFLGWYPSGRLFRSGIVYNRGCGKVFYFQPGHETVPTFHNPDIQLILTNAVKWAYNPDTVAKMNECPYVKPLEEK